MFGFHGWATLRFTAENCDRDDEEEVRDAAVEAVQSYVRQMGYGPVSYQPFELQDRANVYSGALVSAAKANVVLDVRLVNGEAHLWAAGAKNHATPIRQELLDLYHYIARIAPGSNGLLYI
jgi:Immunity protein 7